jgi:hypothetical protein
MRIGADTAAPLCPRHKRSINLADYRGCLDKINCRASSPLMRALIVAVSQHFSEHCVVSALLPPAA